jgi:hypothetical protein
MTARIRALACVAVLACASAAHGQPPPELAKLQFLVGDWNAIGSPPGESGAFIFSLAVQDRIIVRTNYATYAAREGRPASRHDDLMVIFVEDGALKADYFDSEQHVIHYAIDVRGPRDAVFVSPPKAAEPRYRLSYALGADGLLKGTFEIAAPGAPDDFKTMLAWTARKAGRRSK